MRARASWPSGYNVPFEAPLFEGSKKANLSISNQKKNPNPRTLMKVGVGVENEKEEKRGSSAWGGGGRSKKGIGFPIRDLSRDGVTSTLHLSLSLLSTIIALLRSQVLFLL